MFCFIYFLLQKRKKNYTFNHFFKDDRMAFLASTKLGGSSMVGLCKAAQWAIILVRKRKEILVFFPFNKPAW